MSFTDYIKGQRKGADAHRIEKDSMADPFMYEAIEGFDSINDNHTERIKDIQRRINIKSKTIKRRQPIWQSVAACAVVVFGIAGYMVIGYHGSNDLHARDMAGNTIINIYVPEEYYVENIAAIAMHNTETAKKHKPDISRFSVDANIDAPIEEELDMLSDKPEQMMDVYAPENFNDEANPSGSIQKGKPEPVGGYEKYNQYLKDALRRPTDDSCKDRQGKVAIEFSVDEQGRPYLFEVKQSLCGTCDNEAIRLIQSGPKWVPGTERASVRVIF